MVDFYESFKKSGFKGFRKLFDTLFQSTMNRQQLYVYFNATADLKFQV